MSKHNWIIGCAHETRVASANAGPIWTMSVYRVAIAASLKSYNHRYVDHEAMTWPIGYHMRHCNIMWCSDDLVDQQQVQRTESWTWRSGLSLTDRLYLPDTGPAQWRSNLLSHVTNDKSNELNHEHDVRNLLFAKTDCLRQQQSPTNWFPDLMPRILPTTSPINLIMNMSVANTLFFATDISNQTGVQPRDQQQVQRTESWTACRKKSKADNRPTTSANKLNH